MMVVVVVLLVVVVVDVSSIVRIFGESWSGAFDPPCAFFFFLSRD